ncbi:MAG TPA: sigma-70 family RNA polymerase sigma factor [Streptosporangiaceae bacterium]|nr:sigma-70 family RNA polymerase sigma factor [Streptosporangiaceae bacterium]
MIPSQGFSTVSDRDEPDDGARADTGLADTGLPDSGLPDSASADTALAALVADGDREALAVLYQRHRPACYRVARQITASGALAEDAVQEAFAGMWQAPRSYLCARGSVRNWLLALTHHKAVDLVRRETAERRRMGAEADRQAVAPPGDDPATAAWTQIEAAEVRAALKELPPPQRQSLALAYFGGYTQSQIAELTGVPLGTVKTRMFTGMRRMRVLLASLAAMLIAAVSVASGLSGGAPARPAAGCARARTCREVLLTPAGSAAPAAEVIVTGRTVWLKPARLPADNTARQIYVLWQLAGGRSPVAVGAFDVGRHGGRLVRIGSLAEPFRGTRAFAVSIEPGRTIPAAPSHPVARGLVR